MNALINRRMTVDEAVELIEHADLKTLGRMASEMKKKREAFRPTRRCTTVPCPHSICHPTFSRPTIFETRDTMGRSFEIRHHPPTTVQHARNSPPHTPPKMEK